MPIHQFLFAGQYMITCEIRDQGGVLAHVQNTVTVTNREEPSISSYPNPFNATTKIQFFIPHAGAVSVSIYAVTGQKVKTLTEGALPKGTYTISWDGTDTGGMDGASGTYICSIEYQRKRLTRRMLLLR